VMSLAALHGFIQNQGDAWRYTLDSLSQFFAAALTRRESEHAGSVGRRHPLELQNGQVPAHVHELIGAYSDAAQMMGRRTAELHVALSADETDPQFAPEPFTDHSRQAFYHSMVGLTKRTFQLLRQLEPQDEVRKLLEQEEQIRGCFRAIPDRRIAALRIRLHDDLRLEQLLHTGKDFMFTGLGGRADRALSERRIKRSPLRDVASMLLSLEYAAQAVHFDQVSGVTRQADNMPTLEFWAGYWSDWVSALFLKGYFDRAGQTALLPPDEADVRRLLDAFLIERALEEIGRELSDRPEWVCVPARFILRVLELAPVDG